MADDVTTVVYAWVLDGISVVFVTNAALDDAWAVASGFVSVHTGLKNPRGLPMAINLRTLYPQDTTATFEVHDNDGSLASLFGTNRDAGSDLIFTLPAATDPAPGSTHDKHVGLERIGPVGERRRYSAIPGYEIGMEHLGGVEAFANGLDAAPVSDEPILWAGRRCAVYRVKLVEGTYQTLAESARVWWGTMRGNGTQHVGKWTFTCYGPHSWLAGNLATGNFEDGLRCLPITELTDDGQVGETLMGGDLLIRPLTGEGALVLDPFHVYVDLATNDSHLVGLSSYDDIVDAVNLFIDDLIADTSGIGGFAYNENGNDIRFAKTVGSDGIVVQWRRGQLKPDQGDPYVEDSDPSTLSGYLRLRLHEKVWAALGYNVRLQNSDRDPIEQEAQYGQFSEAPIPGYWYGEFWAASPLAMNAFETGDFAGVPLDAFSSGGFDRVWPTLYPGGMVSFSGEPGQEFQIDSPDPVLLSGSKSRPVMADPNNNTIPFSLGGGVGDVNRQGLIVLQGPYRRRGDAEEVDPQIGFGDPIELERLEGRTTQVVRACWRASAEGVVATDSDGRPRFVVYRFEEPRLYGFAFERLDGTWGGWRLDAPERETIKARPISVWEYTDEGDRSGIVLQRLMLTTGTAGKWYTDVGLTTELFGLGGADAFLDVGDNDNGADVPSDAEIAGMGLAIPGSMVAPTEVWAAIPAVVGQSLSRAKVTAYGAVSALQLVKRLLAPMGFAIGYSSGKYTPFDAWKFPTPEDAALTITTRLYAGRPAGDPVSLLPMQQHRQWSAIDELEISATIDPLTGDYAVPKLRRRASDFGSRYRPQRVVHKVLADYLINPEIPFTGSGWTADLAIRWRQGFTFWGTDNTVVPVKLHTEDAIDVFPGDGVTITDSSLLSRAGMYGVSVAVGIVLSRNFSPGDETITLTVMMAAESEYRMYAPSAKVIRYDEDDDALGFRLECTLDEFGDRFNGDDLAGFVEPSWSAEGGDADIELFQHDGLTWSGGIFGVVTGTSPGFLQLSGALTGSTFKSDAQTIVVFRTFAGQTAAWVLRWHAATSGKDGTHSGGAEGEKWRGL